MATKKTGLSRELIIHPGETIADVLDERNISQVELAARTGVSPAYVSNVLAGKKDISAKFAMALEYALDVPKSFWLNLQANYDAELLELNEANTITEQERAIRDQLVEIVKHLRKRGRLPIREKKDDSILSLRKVLQISNLTNLGRIAPEGAFRMASSAPVNEYVLGAWIRMCQLYGEKSTLTGEFNENRKDDLINELKMIMMQDQHNVQISLREVLRSYGIDFMILRKFRGAPVQGYISRKKDGSFQIFMTIRGSWADIFWFSLFHELGHIFNGDVTKTSNFIDSGTDLDKEDAANKFASDHLLDSQCFKEFIESKGYQSIDSICKFAVSQNVRPYIVIGRLQKMKYLEYNQYTSYRTRYKWADD